MGEKLFQKLLLLSEKYSDEINDVVNKKRIIDIYESLYLPILNEISELYDIDNTWLDFTRVKLIRGKQYRFEVLNDNPSNNLYTLRFEKLYPNVILKLHDANILKFNNELYGKIITDLIRYYEKINGEYNSLNYDSLENYMYKRIVNHNVKILTNIMVNATYGILGANNCELKSTNFHVISQYMSGDYELLKKLLPPSSLISVNVDEVKFTNYQADIIKNIIDHIANKSGLPYKIVKNNEESYITENIKII